MKSQLVNIHQEGRIDDKLELQKSPSTEVQKAKSTPPLACGQPLGRQNQGSERGMLWLSVAKETHLPQEGFPWLGAI